jgi:tripartite-type tricarboxylate transporter receptor subunit TctC
MSEFFNYFRRHILERGIASLCLITVAATATAQDYPTRPVRIVVGFTAGGPTDVPARFLADKLSAALGKPVIVENKPGAGSMLATYDLLSQPRDGYTLLICTYFDPVNTLLYKKARYKVSDIAPVTLIAKYDYGIAVSANNPAQNFSQLVQYAKQNPGKLNYGHLGIGSTQNILAKKLEKVTGMSMTAIPYKGAADALQEVVAGRLDLFIGPPLVVMPLFQSKLIKVLAVTGPERLSSVAEVPTLTESGIPLVAFAWLGVCAGSGTPQPIIDLLNSKLVPIINSSEYREMIEKSGSTPISSTPQEMQMVINDTVKDAAPVIQEFNLQMD